MARAHPPLFSFNRGEVSKKALARVDVERLRLSAETQVNWMPWVLGPMMLRPGLQYVGGIRNNLACRFIPFVFSNTDLALIELTASKMRVWVVSNDTETLVARADVDTVVTNGDFSSSTGWTLTTNGTGASAAISGGKLTMDSPTAGGLAQAKRTVTVSVGDQNVEHAFRITVDRGPVVFRAGSTDGAKDYIADATLETGSHSLAFTPTGGNVFIQIETTTAQEKIVDAITIEATGNMELPTNWVEADLSKVTYHQSGDVIFVACNGQKQQRIERRAVRSWSVVDYKANDGPFAASNGTDITLTPSVQKGNGTLTASRAFFETTHVGCLFRLFSSGQNPQSSIAAENTFTSAIRVAGVGEDRRFSYSITGTWSGTITLQRSIDSESAGFIDVSSFTSNTSSTLADGLSNTVAWYRLGYKTGDYPQLVTNGTFDLDSSWTKGTGWTIAAGVASCDGSQAGDSDLEQVIASLTNLASYVVTFTVSGYSAGTITPVVGTTAGTARSADGTFTETIVCGASTDFALRADADFVGSVDVVKVNPTTSATCSLTYVGGGDSGIVRVTGWTSTTVVNMEVLSELSSTAATTDWNEGDWSDRVGWPSAVRFYDGRLWWAGRDKIWGSVSDSYNSHDIETEGDSGPINRSVGFGPVDRINWLLDLSRLVVGREGAETSVRSGSFDDPLTPTNFTLKDCSTQGSAGISGVKIDTRGVFVQQSGRKVYDLVFSPEVQDYQARDLTRLHPDIAGEPDESFVGLCVQRQPDTQLHLPRDDGQCAVLLNDRDDGVEAWWRIHSSGANGEIEAVAVLPGTVENRVYYCVKRTIDGGTVRYLEKLARRDQCRGLPGARCADSHIIYDGTSTTAITGLDHLEGETVVAWGWDDADTAGKDLGTYTVASGAITLSEAVQNACVGLAYTAQFKSAKLAYAAQMGTAVNQKKKLNRIGLVLADTHYQGLQFGQNFTRMDHLPQVKDGVATAADTVHEDFDGPMTTLPGNWDTDSRLCLQAASPRPCMVMSAVIDITTNE